MKKVFLALILALLLLPTVASTAQAKRLLPRAKPAGTRTTVVSASGPGVSVRFRGDRLAIDASFSNLSSTTAASYVFSYDTRGTTQGASGSINVAENNTTREIIFGTCSHGVCRYDSGISNAKFVVTLKLANGKRIVKTFRLKV